MLMQSALQKKYSQDMAPGHHGATNRTAPKRREVGETHQTRQELGDRKQNHVVVLRAARLLRRSAQQGRLPGLGNVRFPILLWRRMERRGMRLAAGR